jgi:hypothetical protein
MKGEDRPRRGNPPKNMDIYIGEYWFNSQCIKILQKDPFISNIEITVHDYINHWFVVVSATAHRRGIGEANRDC